jgi:peptidoglycan/LPS O-acetylase OafA/YrhL
MHSVDLRRGIRVASLDAWRGLAALMVVAMHSATPVLINSYPELRDTLVYRHVVWGNYGVQIFFVISGLCVAQAALRVLNKPTPLTDFLRSRIRRIYPPYAIVSVLSVLASAAAAYLVAHNVLPHSTMASDRLFARPLWDYACSGLLLQEVCHISPLVPVFWSLCYEAAFYVLVALTLLAALACNRDRLVLDVCHGITLACCAALLLAPGAVPYPFDLWPEFGLGVLALEVLTLRRSRGYWLLLATVLLQGVYGAIHLNDPTVFYKPNSGEQAIAATAFACFLVAINPIDDRIARWWPVRLLAYVGVFSYSLYLLHWLVIGVVAQIMKRLGVASADTYWISALSQTAVAVLAARVFYIAGEKPFLTRRRKTIDIEATATTAAVSLPT